MWDDGRTDRARIARALKASHRVTSRVELWSAGTIVTDAAPFETGSVTDEWVNGIRRHLSMTIQPTRQWLRWLDYPQLELRPYRGIQFSRADSWECPMGRFPLLYPEISRPVSSISLSVDDYWQRVQQATLTHPVRIPQGPVIDAVQWLIRDAGMPDVEVYRFPLSTATPSVLVDKSRHEFAMDLAKSYDFELYVSRVGVPTMTNVLYQGASTSDVTSVSSMKADPDWSKVYNTVSVRSSAQDVDASAIASITDPQHPAHPARLGTPGYPSYRVLEWSSPTIRNDAQARQAAASVLMKASAKAVTYSYECVPDPSRDAGDSMRGATLTGSRLLQIQSITTPLQAGKGTVDTQQITAVSTQLDYTE